MIKEKLSLVPELPGCYLMHDKNDTIIYVGKAKKLKRRLSSYFNREHAGKTAKLVSEIVDFEYIVTNSEMEALVLEINLIKKYDPKYNILLRDDKSYPYIELTKEKYPKLQVVRNVNLGKNKYKRIYGPYPNVHAARTTVNLLNRIYPLRKCSNLGKDYCLYYHIHQCLGYCKKDISDEEINKITSEIIDFLNGNYDNITNKIKCEMEEASEKLNFEKAKKLKELLDYIDVTLTRQKVELHDNINRDIFGYYVNNGYISIQVFFLRGGKLVAHKSDIYPIVDEINEELVEYISRFYDKNNIKPKEIFIPELIEDSSELLKEILEVNVFVPKKGEKKKLIDMACDNAKISLENKFELIQRDEQRTIIANEELGNLLNIDGLDRIEIFDNSNIFGSFNVSGMVVFRGGKPDKNEYRKFNITNQKNDDFHTMQEVIYRRYFRLLKEKKKMPDMIIVDGGKSQITAAKEILTNLNLNIPLYGLVKNNKHRTSDLMDSNYNIVEIDRNSNVFHLLTRMQDEVHNYTISYHRQIRSKGALESILDNINGIGIIRKKQLLKKYGSLKKLKEVSIQELEEILPKEVAYNLHEILNEMK